MAEDLGGEPVDQLGMRRPLAQGAEVAGGLDQAPAEVVQPDPVDEHPADGPATVDDGPAGGRWPGWIGLAWRLAYQRPASPEELGWARAFVAEQLDAIGQDGEASDRERAVLTNLCQQLLSSNEFLYVD